MCTDTLGRIETVLGTGHSAHPRQWKLDDLQSSLGSLPGSRGLWGVRAWAAFRVATGSGQVQLLRHPQWGARLSAARVDPETLKYR